MKENILKDIGDKVIIHDDLIDEKEIVGVISMITVTRKGIKYRAKFGFDRQLDFTQEQIIG